MPWSRIAMWQKEKSKLLAIENPFQVGRKRFDKRPPNVQQVLGDERNKHTTVDQRPALVMI